MSVVRTGGEVDAVCTKCRMVLAHTVIAMVGSKPIRVQCNTCNGQHNYRAGAGSIPAPKRAPSGSGSASSPSTKAPKATAVRLSFDDLLAQRKTGLARPYSPKIAFLLDEVIQHPTFGTGFVSAVRPDKVEVTFRSGMKILVHARG